MKKKEYLFGETARRAITDVATHLGDIVGSTLGPAGRNYLLPDGTTNDGKTIVQHIRYDDECKDDIALSFYEVALRTDQEAGDGTSTATVLATELAKSVLPQVPDINAPAMDGSVMALARQLEEEKDEAVAHLEGLAQPVQDLATLEQIAFTSTEDAELGKLIAETVWEAGKDAYVALEDGFNGRVEKTVYPGIKVPARTAAPFMHTNDRKEAVREHIPVLVAKHVFEDYAELGPLVRNIIQANNDKKFRANGLAIVAQSFSIPFIRTVANTSRATNFPIVLLQMDADEDTYQDLAAYLGAEFIDTHPKNGTTLARATYKSLGSAGKLIASAKHTVFIRGGGLDEIVTPSHVIQQGGEPTNRVQARVIELESQLETETQETKRDALKRRISSLSGGIATIYVDAKTAQERHYLKLKVQDATNACKSALEHGFLPGGGQGLKLAAEALGEDALLYDALMAPYRRIQQNAGGSLDIPETVIDSAFSAITGLKNAVSVVKILATTEGIVSDHVRDFAEELGDKLFGSSEGAVH